MTRARTTWWDYEFAGSTRRTRSELKNLFDADITKERVRRVIERINREDAKIAKEDEDKLFSLRPSRLGGDSLGFRVFKLAESNFTTWDALVAHEPKALQNQLDFHVDHIRDEPTADDILYELLLKSGFPLSVKFSVFSFQQGKLVPRTESYNRTTEPLKTANSFTAWPVGRS